MAKRETLHILIIFARKSLACLTGFILMTGLVQAAGGCGSACLPLEALDVMGSQVDKKSFRASLTWQYARFDNFREGSDSVTNNAGAEATIQDLTLFMDYGLTDRFTASLLVPYINKRQNRKNAGAFNIRTADGIGDVALFGRYELLSPKTPDVLPGQLVSPPKSFSPGPSVAVGLGLKFPTGSINEPGGAAPRLPPAFQNGTGAYDLIATVNYFQSFLNYSLFGNAFARIPLEDNKRDYKFGNEYEAHFGVEYPLRRWIEKVDLTLSLDYLHGQRDHDKGGILPPPLRRGTEVLNTGGTFLDITPGITVRPTRKMAAQFRVFIPIHEGWNGSRAANIGQVAPDFTLQATLSYLFD